MLSQIAGVADQLVQNYAFITQRILWRLFGRTCRLSGSDASQFSLYIVFVQINRVISFRIKFYTYEASNRIVHFGLSWRCLRGGLVALINGASTSWSPLSRFSIVQECTLWWSKIEKLPDSSRNALVRRATKIYTSLSRNLSSLLVSSWCANKQNTCVTRLGLTCGLEAVTTFRYPWQVLAACRT